MIGQVIPAQECRTQQVALVGCSTRLKTELNHLCYAAKHSRGYSSECIDSRGFNLRDMPVSAVSQDPLHSNLSTSSSFFILELTRAALRAQPVLQKPEPTELTSTSHEIRGDQTTQIIFSNDSKQHASIKDKDNPTRTASASTALAPATVT
jgi:hypothetical protein